MYAKYGSVRRISRVADCTFHHAYTHYTQARTSGELPEVDAKTAKYSTSQRYGRTKELDSEIMPLPKKGEVRRYILTCAQNNTAVHKKFLKNLEALSAFYNADLFVSRFTYIKRGLGALGDKSETVRAKDLHDDLSWDTAVTPYLFDGRAELAPGLIWCGELNISPTSSRPLSGMGSYARGNSAVIPHPRLALEAIATPKYQETNHLYTTGCVTKRNYIQKKAGTSASFHHTYGALLVEVQSDGKWWARQLVAEDTSGAFYDLELLAKNGSVEISEDGIEAIIWGDIHVAQRCDKTYGAQWFGEGSMIDVLRPKKQFMHDLLDFRARNHHDKGNFLLSYKKHLDGTDCVVSELEQACDFMVQSSRPWCKTYVVESNHDCAMDRYILESDFKEDPKNMKVYLKTALAALGAVERGEDFSAFPNWATTWFKEKKVEANNIKFLKVDEDHYVKGILVSMHGHLGINGARGSARAFSRGKDRTITGHTHSAAIHDGSWVVAVSAKLDQGYNKGMGTWSHTDCLVYPNGKRCLVQVKDGQWRANA